jgi:hypothetical protein
MGKNIDRRLSTRLQKSTVKDSDFFASDKGDRFARQLKIPDVARKEVRGLRSTLAGNETAVGPFQTVS